MTSQAVRGALGRVGMAVAMAGDAMGRPPADPAIAYLKSGRLSVMNADGTNAREIYVPATVIPIAAGLSWSPDGGSIAFIEAIAGSSLCRIDVSVVGGVPQGINRVVLLPDPGAAATYWAPAWSPLGDEIAFAETSSGVLMTIPAAGGTPQALVAPPAGARLYEPAWSPDGAFIAFLADFDGSSLGTIGLLERSTGTVTTVLGPMTLNVREIDWARTQNTLLFEGELQGAPGIYFLPVTGGAPQFVRTGLGPSWAPDDSDLVIWEPAKPNKPVNGGNPYVVKRLNLTTGATVTLGQGQCTDWRR